MLNLTEISVKLHSSAPCAFRCTTYIPDLFKKTGFLKTTSFLSVTQYKLKNTSDSCLSLFQSGYQFSQ